MKNLFNILSQVNERFEDESKDISLIDDALAILGNYGVTGSGEMGGSPTFDTHLSEEDFKQLKKILLQLKKSEKAEQGTDTGNKYSFNSERAKFKGRSIKPSDDPSEVDI